VVKTKGEGVKEGRGRERGKRTRRGTRGERRCDIWEKKESLYGGKRKGETPERARKHT
jgi:hypothetical protein